MSEVETTAQLTPKQALFVQEYLIDRNATQACIRAGYSARNADKIGPELLGHSRVSAAIDEASEKVAKKLEISAEYVLGKTLEIVERASAAGDECDFKAALKGLELLGKYKKLWTEKVEHSGSVNTGPRTMTDEEIDAAIAARAKELERPPGA